jgi:TRAP-type uncharacterized transport system substrate-binding protein
MRISMPATRILFATFCLFSAAPLLLDQALAQKQATYEDKKRQTNDIAVSIVVSGISCTCARFAEDIRNVVNDLRPGGLRVLPVLGVGGLQNLNDVLFLKGVDMAVVDEDNMRLLKKRDPQLYANIEQRVHYITKLYNSEFHVIARNDIKGYNDLRGKKVNFNLKDSQTEVTAEIVFKMLNIEVQRSNYDNDEAIKKLRDGEIAAMIILSGAPQAALSQLKKEDGVHFLALDESSLPDRAALFGDYLPIELTHEQYPALIPQGMTVPTIANRALLVAYSWPEKSARYNRLARFVRDFFGRIDQFKDGARHPKWREINIAADIPGWTRFKPAADWLLEHREVIAAPVAADRSSSHLKEAFDRLVSQYVDSKGKQPISDTEREALFRKFQQVLGSQNRH